MEQKTAQVRLKNRRYICAEVPWGPPVFVTPSLARTLSDAGVVDIIGGVGPTQFKPSGPTQGKIIGRVVAARDEKKSSSAVPDGRLTDSQQSSELGQAERSLLLAAAQASPEANVKPPEKRRPGRPPKSK